VADTVLQLYTTHYKFTSVLSNKSKESPLGVGFPTYRTGLWIG